MADLFIRHTFFHQMLRKSKITQVSPCQTFPLYGTRFLVYNVLSFCGVQELEDQLDVGNIVVARNEAELRVSL